MKRKKSILLGLFFLMFVTVSCQGINGGSSEAEKTLEAIYMEQTIEAEIAKREQQSQGTLQAINIENEAAQQTADAELAQEEQEAQQVEETQQAQEAQQAEETQQALEAQETVEAVVPTDEPEPTPTATPEIVHLKIPGDPTWITQWWTDSNSKHTANEHRAGAGDYFGVNLLERPFTSKEMIYRPDLDIIRIELYMDNTFCYVKIFLSGNDMETGTLNGWYGVEFDLDVDGHGDLLIWARNDDNQEWNIEDVFVYEDKNNDVGGSGALMPESPNFVGDGYETVVFSPDHLTDPDMAWKRRDPNNPTVIALAIKISALGYPATFMWNAWADDGLQDPRQFDYHDYYTYKQAGSAFSTEWNYPIDEVYLTDNTCRLPFGFEPTGFEAGVCYAPAPTPTLKPYVPKDPCDCSVGWAKIYTEDCCVSCGHTWNPKRELCYPIIP